MPPKKIYYYYKVCIESISKRIGKIRSYQIQNEELIEIIQRQNLLINSLKKQLSDRENSIHLERPKMRMDHFESCGLSHEGIAKLSWEVEKLQISTRLLNILKPMDLHTVEDLVRYIKDHGLSSFVNQKNFGKKCQEELLSVLITNEILYDETTSPYFIYL